MNTMNLNVNTTNPIINTKINQPASSNMSLPKSQPYQYTYHSFNNQPSTNSVIGTSIIQQSTSFNPVNKFVPSSSITTTHINNPTSTNGYQYHYSYSNQSGSSNIANNFNTFNNNQQNFGHPYHGYIYGETGYNNGHSYMGHDEQLLEGLPGD